MIPILNFFVLEEGDEKDMIAISDHEYDPKNYIIIQKGKKLNDDDLLHGFDKPYIEINGQQYGQYGGIKRAFQIDPGIIMIEFEKGSPLAEISDSFKFELPNEKMPIFISKMREYFGINVQ